MEYRVLRTVSEAYVTFQVYEEGMISKEITQQALKVLRVDAKGLDHIDRKLLTAMIDLYDGGPVGRSHCGEYSEDAETTEDMYEIHIYYKLDF